MNLNNLNFSYFPTLKNPLLFSPDSVGNIVKSLLWTPNMRRITRDVAGNEDFKRADFHRTGGAIIIG